MALIHWEFVAECWKSNRKNALKKKGKWIINDIYLTLYTTVIINDTCTILWNKM